MPFELFDIGVNLTDHSFVKDADAIVERAHHAGVSHLTLIGSNIEDSRKAAQLAESFQNCYSTAGIHPHHADEFNDQSLPEIRQLTQHPSVKALGEMGLDFNRNFSTPDNQRLAFEAQLELATEIKLPIFLHQRDAHDNFLALLKKYRDRIDKAVAHCFTGSKEELFDYLDLDLYIGITGWICDERRGSHLLELIPSIPTERLLLETDAPYLLPRTIKPKPKSRRNEPAFLHYVLDQVAECSQQTKAEVADITSANAKRFFGIIG